MAMNKSTLYIKGMHCPSCDILVKDKFCEMRNVKNVKANYKTQTAEITYEGKLDQQQINTKLQQFGYSISEKNEKEFKEPFINRLGEAGVIAVIAFAIFYFIQDLKVFPELNVSSGLTFFTVFILGVVASTSTCMATSGALFLTTIGKLKEDSVSFKKNIIPALSFNIGRVLSYGVFGFIVGMIGKVFSVNLQMELYLNLFVSTVMILIALDMLKLFSFSWISSMSFTKGLFEKLRVKFIQKPKQTAFFLGAITYLLPCGFTQSVQIYALGLADPVKSALIMMIFALGTVPSLLAIGFASSFTKSAYYPLFQKIMGVIILMVGASYIMNFATLRGFSLPILHSGVQGITTASNVQEQNGVQILEMSVDNKGYSPSAFTVKQGKPVKWLIDAKNVFGCQSVLVAPKLGIEKPIALGKNELQFTPQEKGVINFSCSMGMYKGMITVI